MGKHYWKEIMLMKETGYTHKQIGEELEYSQEQIKQLVKRNWKKQVCQEGSCFQWKMNIRSKLSNWKSKVNCCGLFFKKLEESEIIAQISHS